MDDELSDAYFGAVSQRWAGHRWEWRAELPCGGRRIEVTLGLRDEPPGDAAAVLAAAREPVRRILAGEPEIRRRAAAALLPAARDWTEAAAGRRAIALPKIVSDAEDIERRIVPVALHLDLTPGADGRMPGRLSYDDDKIFRGQAVHAGLAVTSAGRFTVADVGFQS
ncbi:hypothetical protein ACRB68_11660 [Actinomadura sp. RB68]|uniref:Uncharacterized protein n=2 Tax=Actinomadura macrotermitis TaxID=2585200 RepID=A0A7K0BPM9_9ACTN|nr:hypothetical protein [Actinomadura macrotermitis]